MTSPEFSNQPEVFSLLTMFSQFYQRIVKIKMALDSSLPGNELAKLIGNKIQINDADQAMIISNDLHTILRTQHEKLNKYCSAVEIDAYKQCQYIMASLADELFLLRIKWDGQDDWLAVTLEQKLFGSSSAGVLLFDKIDTLLANKIQNTINSQLAAVYLLALRLGFHGKYQDDDTGTLAHYRSNLFRMTGNAHTLDGNKKLFSDTYAYQLNPLEKTRLAPLSKWYRMMLAAIVAYLFLTLAAWKYAVYTLYF